MLHANSATTFHRMGSGIHFFHMNLFCYESLENDPETFLLSSTFSNIRGKQVVETEWFYDSKVHMKSMVGQREKGVNTLRFTLVRPGCLKIQIDYELDHLRQSLVRYSDETGDRECQCPVIVQEDEKCTTVKIFVQCFD